MCNMLKTRCVTHVIKFGELQFCSLTINAKTEHSLTEKISRPTVCVLQHSSSSQLRDSITVISYIGITYTVHVYVFFANSCAGLSTMNC